MQRVLWFTISFLAALVLFAVCTLHQRSVAADEFSMFWAARLESSQILTLYFSSHENNPAAPALVQHYWGIVFGYGDASLRILSLLFASGGIWFLWKIVQLYTRTIDETRRSKAQATVFLVAVSTPFIWMSATFARYQPMVLLLGLAAFYYYSLWFGTKLRRHLLLYVVLTALTFYFHYLSAAMFALSAGVHYLSTLRGRSRAEVLEWIGSQVGIIVLILPVVFLIARTYAQMDLSANAPLATNKVIAVMLFLASAVLGIVNGFVVAPWTVWVVLPMMITTGVLVVLGLQRNSALQHRTAVFFIAFPLVIMSIVVVRMYPPQTIYLIPSVQRVGFLAPLAWVFLGTALVSIQRQWLQRTLLATIIVCNCYAIAVWNLNVVAVQHTPPLRESVQFIEAAVGFPTGIPASDTTRGSNYLLAHSVGYRYGMESVSSGSAGSEDAFQRYLPWLRTAFWAETDIWRVVTPEECLRLVQRYSTQNTNSADRRMSTDTTTAFVQNVFILQRNRYPKNAQMLAKTLLASGYTLRWETPLQQQTVADMWFKAQLLKLGVIGMSGDAAPQEFLYTLRYLQRQQGK
jgi:Dolichyl-phosphate-mannose-protein mannosyltransferase